MEPRIIKTEEEYDKALAEVERLIALDPEPTTPEGERLELNSTLVEKYELEYFPFEKPDPIETIRFRMEQQELKQRDLIPYIGSRSKVSEILSGKRSLTLSMIRALSEGLGIPAEILIQEGQRKDSKATKIEWGNFPVKEMVKRGWIDATPKEVREQPIELVQKFFNLLGGHQQVFAHYRRTLNDRTGTNSNDYALRAWCARVLVRARQMKLSGNYHPGTVTKEFLTELIRLSPSNYSPLLAQEFLAKHSIALVIEPHLPQTRLDGAAMIDEGGTPVVGITLRHDRIDNFWYTLMHELAHVSLHLKTPDETYIDDLDTDPTNLPKEQEADRFAGEILIPRSEWKFSRALRQKTPNAVEELAEQLRIHPAIVAGRIRRDCNDYMILNQMVGHGQVRKLFSEAK